MFFFLETMAMAYRAWLIGASLSFWWCSCPPSKHLEYAEFGSLLMQLGEFSKDELEKLYFVYEQHEREIRAGI